jgi:hypothetical protein
MNFAIVSPKARPGTIDARRCLPADEEWLLVWSDLNFRILGKIFFC